MYAEMVIGLIFLWGRWVMNFKTWINCRRRRKMNRSLHIECQVYLLDQYISSLINQFTKLKPGNLAVQYTEKHQSNKWTIKTPCVQYNRAENIVLWKHRKRSLWKLFLTIFLRVNEKRLKCDIMIFKEYIFPLLPTVFIYIHLQF